MEDLMAERMGASMEDLRVEGNFWLPGQPDKNVGGVLELTQESGGLLRLFGSLPKDEIHDDSVRINRIIGKSEKYDFTLDQCFQKFSKLSLFGDGSDRQSFYVGRVIQGAVYSQDEPLEADGVSVRLSNLLSWTKINGVETIPASSPSDPTWAYRVTAQPEISAEFSEGRVSLVHGYGTGSEVRKKFFINQWISAKFELPSSRPLAEVMDIASDFQDLVTIATDRIAGYEKIFLRHPDFLVDGSSGSERYHEVSLIAQWKMKGDPEKYLGGDNLVFSFEALGGIDGVVRWLDTAKTYRSQLGRVMATRYNPQSYSEDRFLGCAAALESLHGEVTGTSNDGTNFKARMISCAQEVCDWFKELVPEEKFSDWARIIKDDRNNIAHHLGRTLHQDTAEITFYGDSLYWLFILYFLKQARVPEAVFAQVVHNRRFMWTGERVRSLLA